MSITVPNFSDQYKFWFYFRKALFQVFFPIALAFMSLCDFAVQSNNNDSTHAYDNLYFYTLLILFLYTGMKQILEFIFTVCADDVVFKKEINLEQTTSQLLLSINTSNSTQEGHFIIAIKKIFKLRYSKSPLFVHITKICWFLGIDCPILIPDNIISKLSNAKDDITLENEQEFLHTTLMNLYAYHPKLYEITPITENNDDEIALVPEGMVPKRVTTQIDKIICEMQNNLFGKENEFNVPNVV
jgi:hypothetical protein